MSEVLKLIHIPANFIDQAWADGAHALSEACDMSGGEITGSQLKMILARGERILIKMDGGDCVGWGVVRIDQLPNFRVLHVCEMTAKNMHYERFFAALEDMARGLGCSRIRCSCKERIARLHKIRLGLTSVYETLERVL